MAITPLAGYMIDPNNPNGVVRDPNYGMQTASYPAQSYTPPSGTYREGDVVPGMGTIMPDGTFGNPAPAQTPVAQSTPASSGLTSYIPTQTADELAYQNAIKAENDRLAGLAAPETEADRRTRITNQFQGEIDALNAVYATQKQQAIATGMGRLGSDSAVQARRGLIGSSFGAGQTSAVETANNQDLQDVEAARGAALAAVYSKIRSAITESETDKKAAQATSAAANIAYLKSVPEKKNKIANEAIKALITAKAEPTDKDLQEMAAQIGIDPSLMKQSYMTAVEDKKKELEKELAAQQKAKQDAEKTALDMLKTNVDISKPYESGGYLWQYDDKSGSIVKIGDARSITQPKETDDKKTAAEITQYINTQMATPEFKAMSKDQKKDFILANGGTPGDFTY